MFRVIFVLSILLLASCSHVNDEEVLNTNPVTNNQTYIPSSGGFSAPGVY